MAQLKDGIVETDLEAVRRCTEQLRSANNIPAVAVRAIIALRDVCYRQQQQIEDIPHQIAAALKKAERRADVGRILASMGHGFS